MIWTRSRVHLLGLLVHGLLSHRFTVNRRISVVGFGLYGSIHGPTDYQVNIQIIEYEKKQTLGQNDTGFSCDGTANTFRVMFKEPIEILPNVCYTACATLKVRAAQPRRLCLLCTQEAPGFHVLESLAWEPLRGRGSLS